MIEFCGIFKFLSHSRNCRRRRADMEWYIFEMFGKIQETMTWPWEESQRSKTQHHHAKKAQKCGNCSVVNNICFLVTLDHSFYLNPIVLKPCLIRYSCNFVTAAGFNFRFYAFFTESLNTFSFVSSAQVGASGATGPWSGPGAAHRGGGWVQHLPQEDDALLQVQTKPYGEPKSKLGIKVPHRIPTRVQFFFFQKNPRRDYY